MTAWVASQQGRAYIDFGYWEDVCVFLTMVANDGRRDEFYERMAHWCAPGAWVIRGLCVDWGLEDGSELAKDGTRLSYFDFDGWQVILPRTDIPVIVKRFRRSRAEGARGRSG